MAHGRPLSLCPVWLLGLSHPFPQIQSGPIQVPALARLAVSLAVEKASLSGLQVLFPCHGLLLSYLVNPHCGSHTLWKVHHQLIWTC